MGSARPFGDRYTPTANGWQDKFWLMQDEFTADATTAPTLAEFADVVACVQVGLARKGARHSKFRILWGGLANHRAGLRDSM